MYIARMQGEKIALKIRIPLLHGPHMPGDFVNDIRDGRLWISQQISIARLLKSFRRKIYLKSA